MHRDYYQSCSNLSFSENSDRINLIIREIISTLFRANENYLMLNSNIRVDRTVYV
jgi:hypothetical protein